jgi:YHS domain-containing protein
MPGCGARYEEMSRSLNDSLTIIRNAQAQDDPARVHAALGDVDTLLSSLRTALDENRTACAAMMAEMRGMMGRSTTGGHLPATAGTSGQSAGQAPPALLAPLRFTTSLDELKSLCGVEKEDPPSVDYRGQKYYFCNDADRARFEKDPEALLKRR